MWLKVLPCIHMKLKRSRFSSMLTRKILRTSQYCEATSPRSYEHSKTRHEML